MTGSHNLALLSPQERKAISDRRAACLERYQAAQQLASSIYSMRSQQGWRVKAERMLAASTGLESEARKALNRMMKK